MKKLLFCFLFTSCCSSAEQIELFNNTLVEIELFIGKKLVVSAEPQNSMLFTATDPLWLDFGIMAHKFDLDKIKKCSKVDKTIQLQANFPGYLYCAAGQTNYPLKIMPPQPEGFPVKSTEIVDVT